VTQIAKYGRLSIFGRPDGGLFQVVCVNTATDRGSPP